MANTPFYVPALRDAGAWLDYRGTYTGGYGWRGDRDLSSISKVVIHHTVTNPSGNAKKDCDLIAQYHIKTNKWGGIGYHFIISSEIINGYAKVAYVGDIANIRAHAPNTKGAHDIKAGKGNYYTLGVSFIGMLHQNLPSNEQIRSAHALLNELIFHESHRLAQLKAWHVMVPHFDMDSTACPGRWGEYKNLIINGGEDMAQIEALKAEVNALKKEWELSKKTIQEKDAKLVEIQHSYSVLENTVVTKNELIEILQADLEAAYVNQEAAITALRAELAEYSEKLKEVEAVSSSSLYKFAHAVLKVFRARKK